MSTTTLTPYLTLWHRLSLTWLAYPIISLGLIAFRLHASFSTAHASLSNAKSTLLASCRAAEMAATSATSVPHILAIKMNEQYIRAVNESLDAARKALVLSLTILESIINFVIDIYRSTLFCFLELAVRTGFEILIAAVKGINEVIQSVASSLRTSIQNDISSANSAIQSFIDGINKINPFSDIKPPQIPMPNLDALNNVQLPPTIQDALTKVNSSLPTVAELKDKAEDIIDKPFELVKKEINDTFAKVVLTPETLPVPERSTMSFCGDIDLSLVDDLGHQLVKTEKIGYIIISLLALAFVALLCLYEWYNWRSLKKHMEYTRQAWGTEPTHAEDASLPPRESIPTIEMTDHNLLMLADISSHPLARRVVNEVSTKLHLSPTTQTNLNWFTSYIFYPTALTCLLVGLLGLISIELQLAALHPLERDFRIKGQQQVYDFSTKIATSMNSSMYAQSSAYTSAINTRITDINTQLSSGILGSIQNTTIHINQTIANFYQDVQNGVETVFGGTILDAPIQEFVRCFLGSKVDAVESVLTFLEREVSVRLPLVNDTILVLQPDQLQELTRPIALAAIGGDASENGTGSQEPTEDGLVQKIVQAYARSLRKERILFLVFIGCWGIIILIAIAIILWNLRARRDGGDRESSDENGSVYDTDPKT